MKKHKPRKSGKSLEFSSHEFAHHDRNHYWYIGISILLLAFLFLTIYTGDYLLSAVVVAVAVAIFRLAGIKPSQKKVSLTDHSVSWGDKEYSYNNFRAFWVGTHGNEYTVYLERLNFQSSISFNVDDKELENALDILSCQLPFHQHRNTPLPEKMGRFFKL